MATRKEQPQGQAQEQPQPQPDEFAGQGGSYILDPATGKRRLVERTDHPDIAARSAAEQKE